MRVRRVSKEIARGTINASEATKESLIAALGLMRNDRDSYQAAYCRCLTEIKVSQRQNL
jgi:hypothetical protein